MAFLGKAKDTIVKAVDQNGDGSLDLKDVSVITETIGNATKNTAAAIKDSAEARSRELERKTLHPVFAEDLDSADFLISKLIRITDIDKKRAESEVCKGSIGYISEQKDPKIVLYSYITLRIISVLFQNCQTIGAECSGVFPTAVLPKARSRSGGEIQLFCT